MIECLFTKYVVVGSSPLAVTKPSDFPTISRKEFPDIEGTIECGFTLKHVRDMTGTYSEIHRTYKYSEVSSMIWPVSLSV